VTFTLRRAGVRIAYRVDNRDGARLPFGFGLHPYFCIPDGSPAEGQQGQHGRQGRGRGQGAGADRSQVFLKVPLARRMEAEHFLPTGKLLAVAGTAHDLRRPTALTGLALDDVYFGMQPGKRASFELRRLGLTFELSGSAAFTHLVVFTPPDRGFFCIENQTSSTDAHNLANAGAGRTAHLLVVPPGKHAAGHVDWTIRLGKVK
jgi:aldose 1-epimerase